MGTEERDLRKIRSIADYQLGDGNGEKLFPDEVEIIRSKSTGRIRQVLLRDKLLVTLRPTDGLFSLSIEGAKRLTEVGDINSLGVVVSEDVEDFIRSGKSVFAKHVLDAPKEIRPHDEVIVINSKGEVIACGKTLLNREEMLRFESGVAVKVRKGAGMD